MTYRLGIDVGGTNTDAVILDEQLHVVTSTKVHTTTDIETGIYTAMKAVLNQTKIDPAEVTAAMLGTTQCTNAIVERKQLANVGVIRLGYPASLSIVPYTAWPADMISVLSGKYKIVHGGFEYNGEPITPLDLEELAGVLDDWQGQVESIAIVGIFSAIRPEQEEKVAEIIRQKYGTDFPISMSAAIGSIGLIERENATILNAALNKVMQRTANGFQNALASEGLVNAQAYFCQNDGTLMSVDYAKKYPILTIGSGPTNSIRGAAYLAQVQDTIVLDIGGTTSDVGVLSKGFPRESAVAVRVGGIRTNFRMPDINSIGVGGGSVVRQDKAGRITVGPDSVGYQIEDKALVFGGDTITATDIAVRLGYAEVGDVTLVQHLSEAFARQAGEKIAEMLAEAIDQMKTSRDDVQLVLVGGGAIIAPSALKGVRKIIKNEQGPVANAIGATIAQIGSDFEKIYSYEQVDRAQALTDAKAQASTRAVTAGADSASLNLVEVDETPLAYAPGQTTKVRVKVVGELAQRGKVVTATSKQ
ncbi:hydantoinase/oxoprolinase family protein [Lactiplantibacillus pentosus]|uniref:hydantoinase/oxoprolinase family protein n=1 Tax=Lactiplantibacillus pentosus TaxID=1589 RepID=UPI0021A6D250|nr:hydantoinase/oxoprolinase family protein [Lactiplantibacillus pentosus]MCT3283171.1 hydantoinase/oxoprolinase family protein [Lactiplantibacillus pentosus]